MAIFNLPFSIFAAKMPGRLAVGHRPLKATMLVRIQPRQPIFWQVELRQPVSSKSEQQSYKLRTLENYQHGLPILPLSVEVCTPVSETGRAGALPAAAANSRHAFQQRTNTSTAD